MRVPDVSEGEPECSETDCSEPKQYSGEPGQDKKDECNPPGPGGRARRSSAKHWRNWMLYVLKVGEDKDH